MPLPLRDTPTAYGRVTRLLHWLIAALIIWQFLGMGLRNIFGRVDWVGFFVGSHQPVGSVLFVLIVARVVWAALNRRTRPDHGAGAVGLAARLGHAALYAMMVLVPLAAILRAWGSERGFAPFGFPIFAPQEVAVAWTQNFGDMVHGELAWVLGLTILGHIAMVVVHERLWRDGTLAKMAGSRAGR